jgi:arylsulfatase A-like enzyme
MSCRPNIIVIMSDQQRPDSLGCYGNEFVQTPHLDKLAESGASFDNAFTVFPLCTPARATMWTGVYPHANAIMDCVYGIDDAFEYSAYPVTIGSILKKNGYTTGYFGKWHLGNKTPDDWDHWQAFNSGGGHWIDGKQSFQNGEYAPDEQTDSMIELLKSFKKDDMPFFLVQSYYPPHEPYMPPQRYLDLYRGRGIIHPGYYGAVTAIDDLVGRTLEAIEETGYRDNTLIIYTSDHGEHFNYRGRNHKSTAHDDSIRIPLLVNWPGKIASDLRYNDPVGLQDLVPTLMDYAGCDRPDYLQGVSLRPAIEGRDRINREAFYVQNITDNRTPKQWDDIIAKGSYLPTTRDCPCDDDEWDRQRALWTKSWKLILSEGGNHQLYDLSLDPEEELNIFGAPKLDVFYDQYRHFPDHSEITIGLVTSLKLEAKKIDDEFGIELADRVLGGLYNR